MRMLGLLGMVMALVVVGLLAVKQLRPTAAPTTSPGAGAASDAGSPSRQVQQYKQSLDAAMQQRPRESDDN